MSTLHVAIFLPSLRGGGAERVSVSLANELAVRGHRVDLLVAKGGGPYSSHVGPGVRVIDFDVARVSRSFIGLVRYLRGFKPDVLLSVMTHCNAVAISAKVVAASRTKVVVSEHNSTRVNRSKPLLRAVRRYLYRLAHAIVAVSNGIRDELVDFSGLSSDRVVTLYNPLDTKTIATLSTQPVGHPWVKEDIPLAVAVGSLTPQKDFANLIRAVHLVNQDRSLRLAILGEGPLLVELQTLRAELHMTETVEFLGFQDNPFAWMSNSDVFVLSSLWEGLPGALLEALACNSQIVSTDCPTGPDEILESGRWGRLVPTGDAAAMAATLQLALDEPLGIDTRPRAEQFNISNSVDRYEELFRDGPKSMHESLA